MIVHTFLRTPSIPPDEKAKLAAFLETLSTSKNARSTTQRRLAGESSTTPPTFPSVLPFVALVSSGIGTEDKPDNDCSVDLPPAANEAAVFILEDYAFRGRPLWPFVPSTPYAAFLASVAGSANIVTVTWDASLHGWGAILRWWTNRDGKIIVGTLPDSDDVHLQVRRETLTGVLPIEAASRED